MFKNLKYLILFSGLVLAAKPMESLTNYNVIMVHGAAPSGNGIRDSICDAPAYQNYGTVYDARDMMGKGYRENTKEEIGRSLSLASTA